jgi:Uma2 family endonuclease
VLSEGNTPGEMTRKLKDYFLSGVEVVLFVDPRKRTVEVHTPAGEPVVYTEAQTLDGGTVLPGLALPVKEIFARVPKALAKKPAPRKRRKP